MTRTEFQEGPATDHYHEGLGVDNETPSGSVTLLGPYSFTREVDDISEHDTGITLAAGTVLIKAFAIFAGEPESNAPGAILELKLAEADEPGQGIMVASYDMYAGYPDTSLLNIVQPEGADQADTEEVDRSAVLASECHLFVSGNGDWFGGPLNIYALVVEAS